MIIVEIEVPVMGKRYDFQMDEDVSLHEVKKEIVEIWSPDGHEIRQEYSARENALRTGSRIMLV